MRARSEEIRHRRWLSVLAAALAVSVVVAAPGPVRAQAPRDGAVDPGKIRERIQRPEERPKAVEEIEAPAVAPDRRAAVGRPFRLIGAEIVGSTVYPPARLADFYEPYLGHEISLAEVETITEAITEQYRKDGYFLSRAVAPPQSVEFGVLRIRIIEGFVEEVRFSGDRPGRPALFEAWSRRITAERPLRLGTLERSLLLMADVPGLTVRPNVRPIDADQGAYRLEVGLDHAPAGGFLTLDNRGTTTVGPLQSYGGVNLDSALGLLERTHLAGFTVPPTPEELLYFEFQQTHILNSLGTQGWFFASRSSVDIGEAGTASKENSFGTRLLLGFSHPVLRSRDHNLYLTLKLDAFEADKNSMFEVFDDRLRVMRLGTTYSTSDAFDGNSWLNLELSRGLDILGATGRDSALTSRVGGRADFLKATVDLTRTQALAGDWNLLIAGISQWSPHTLLSSEEFAVGGARFGRAYDPADISGSQGVAGVVELQYDVPLALPVLKSVQLYGYYDLGAVWGAGFTRASMASAGGGVRFSLPRFLEGGLEIVKPLTRSASPGEDTGHDPRIFFSLRARF
jgi:hemolysin activation/secretion protein